MSNMIGADPQQLRDLAVFMKQRADLFDSIAQDLGQRLHSAGWAGSDADHSRAQWDAEMRPKMKSAVQALTEASEKLMHNAAEQVAASEGGGAGIGLWISGGALGGLASNLQVTSGVQFAAMQGSANVLQGTWKSPEARMGMQPQELGRKDPKNDAEFNLNLAKVDGSASVVQAKGAVSGDHWSAEGQVDGLYAEGSAGVGFDGKNVEANAAVAVGLLHASGSVAGSYGFASAEAKADVLVGAEANGKFSVGADGVKASGEAFVGARARGEAGIDVGGVGGKVEAEGWAGFGIGGEGKFGIENGKVTFKGEAGAAFFVGGKAGFEVSIDVGKVAETIHNNADAIGDFCKKITPW